ARLLQPHRGDPHRPAGAGAPRLDRVPPGRGEGRRGRPAAVPVRPERAHHLGRPARPGQPAGGGARPDRGQPAGLAPRRRPVPAVPPAGQPRPDAAVARRVRALSSTGWEGLAHRPRALRGRGRTAVVDRSRRRTYCGCLPEVQMSCTSSARLLTSVFAKIRFRCCFTVFSLTNALAAICLVVSPSATSWAISCSRLVRTSQDGSRRTPCSVGRGNTSVTAVPSFSDNR